LSIHTVNGLTRADLGIKLALDGDRAYRCAVAAHGALVNIHITRPLDDRRLELARFAFQFDDIAHGEQIDVGIAHAFDQLGGDDARGAIAGRERFVQARHAAAHGGLVLHQVDVKTRSRKVQRRLNAGNARPANKYGAGGLLSSGFRSGERRSFHFHALPPAMPVTAALLEYKGAALLVRASSPRAFGESPRASPRNCVM